MRQVSLAMKIDVCVRSSWRLSTVSLGTADVDGNQTGNVREAVVADAEESKFVAAEIEGAKSVDLVLLAMLEAFEIAVAVRRFDGDKGVCAGIARTPTSNKIDVAIVEGELRECVEAAARNVGGGEIDRVIPFPHIEGAAIDGDGFDDRRNQEIRIGVTVAVRVCRQIVGIEEIADLIELGDGLAVIAGDTGREILRRLDAAGRGFDR